MKNSWIEIKNHLITNDQMMPKLIKKYGKPSILNTHNVNLFEILVNSIISQQLSTKSANSIKNKFYKLLNTNQITYQSIANTNIVDIKSCGLSQIKSNTIKNISSIINDNPKFLTELKEKSKSDVIKELTKIKGIGIWTAQMFMMSGLKNLDIFAPNDSGLMKGIRIVYFNNTKPKQTDVEQITSEWIPYRTIGSWYMWQVANNN
tara:strand:+ start:64 stop:678 length:615 start_codon:yes stop_codon:yes gene_type:complete